jgi:hypothetical protein
MVLKTVEIDIELSPEEIATEFHKKDEQDQADVFNYMGQQTKGWSDKARRQQFEALVMNLDKDGVKFISDIYNSYIGEAIEPNEGNRTSGTSNRVPRSAKPRSLPRSAGAPGNSRRGRKTTKKNRSGK